MISGINHITISVSNLELSFSFYTAILEFKPVAKWKEGAYLLAGDLWFCLILDNGTRKGPLNEYSHIALSISDSKLKILIEKIKKHDIIVWKENSSEGDSLYILDPDGHKLELHVGDLKSRIASVKADPYDEMEFFI